MEFGVFILVLLSAFIHAFWNFIARKAKGNLAIMWLGMCLASLISFPSLFFYSFQQIHTAIPFILATGIIHALYFILLAKCYQMGDISCVYPIARGVGVMGTAVIAKFFLEEQMSFLGNLGITIICIGILILGMQKSTFQATICAFCVGLTIASYSVVDKMGVTQIPPFFYIWAMFLSSAIFTMPYVLVKYNDLFKEHWKQNKLYVCIIGIGSLSTYMIILFAFQLGNVSYIVATREFAVVLGAMFGIIFLKEQLTYRKVFGILFVVFGLVYVETCQVIGSRVDQTKDTKMNKFKKRVYEVLSDPPEGDVLGNTISGSILLLIAINVLIGILETMDSLGKNYPNFFFYFELFSVVVFTVEYVLRLWSCTTQEDYKESIKGRLRLMKSPMAIIDLLAILPFYLQVLLSGVDLRFIRVLRLFRLFRIFRVGKLAESFGTLINVVTGRREELMISFIVVIIVVILSSNVMYIVEHEAQPEKFGSVPAAMWWGIITVTTIGYGDVYPVTPTGQFIGAIIGFLGICVFALPVAIIGAGFIEEMEKLEKKRAKRKSIQDQQKRLLDEQKSLQDGQKSLLQHQSDLEEKQDILQQHQYELEEKQRLIQQQQLELEEKQELIQKQQAELENLKKNQNNQIPTATTHVHNAAGALSCIQCPHCRRDIHVTSYLEV